MPPGTLVVVRPTQIADIAAGDVLTYQIKSGDPTVVTHRVVQQGVDMTGQPRWRTQGDANDVADQNWVLPVQVKGDPVVLHSLPRLRHLVRDRTSSVAWSRGWSCSVWSVTPSPCSSGPCGIARRGRCSRSEAVCVKARVAVLLVLVLAAFSLGLPEQTASATRTWYRVMLSRDAHHWNAGPARPAVPAEARAGAGDGAGAHVLRPQPERRARLALRVAVRVDQPNGLLERRHVPDGGPGQRRALAPDPAHGSAQSRTSVG